MSSDRLFRPHNLCSVCAVLASLGLGSSLAFGGSANRFLVTRDGQKYGMVKSETEYGVTLRASRDVDAVSKRLALTGQGKMQTVPGTEHGKVRIMRVEKTSAAGRDALRLDPGVEDVRPVYRLDGVESPMISTGEILVRVRPDLSEARRQKLWADYRIARVEPFDGLADVYTLGPLGPDEDDILVAEAIANDPRTVWAQPNLRQSTQTSQVAVSDPLYNYQWHLNNTGQLGGPEGVDIDAPEAWAITEGQGVLFSEFDDSCDVGHPDLQANYIGIGQDPTVSPNNAGFDDPSPKDEGDAHGTAVMGLMVASGNGIGGRGVAPKAKFTASRAILDFISESQVATAYLFALAHDVDVHNNSWGYRGLFPTPEVVVDAISRGFHEGRRRADIDGDGEMDPLGMVVVFSAGNENQNVPAGYGPATLPEVINVGATNELDRRASFSSYGVTVDVVAPGVNIATTDARDSLIGQGYNVGGFDPISGIPDVDPTGNFTNTFGGTSAASPITAGVAGLILSANPRLTATDVRLILEHTAEKIDVEDADYDPITSRSLLYGYGRINAGGAGEKYGAVEAARDSLTNGGYSWPERPANAFFFSNLPTYGTGIFFQQNYGTSDFLVLEGDGAFSFVPKDGACYDERQPGCSGASEPLPGGVEVIAAGCGLNCYRPTPGPCVFGADNCVFLPEGAHATHYALFARNAVGRYSWGVAMDGASVVRGNGSLTGGRITGGGGGIPVDTVKPPAPRPGPAVTVNVAPLRGKSPLTVSFNGNAVSAHPIDESKTAWDFDVDDDVEVDARTRKATHVYTADGADRTFVARFTMADANGDEGSQEVAIFVEADVEDGDQVGSGALRIVVGLPGTPGANVSSGKAPFSVVLSVDASELPGTLQSVAWDLGDGFRASTLTAPHTYYNDGTSDLRLPVTATVTSVTSTGLIATTKATRVITVQPGEREAVVEEPHLPGTGAQGPGGQVTPCGVVGIIPLLCCMMSLIWLRRLHD